MLEKIVSEALDKDTENTTTSHVLKKKIGVWGGGGGGGIPLERVSSKKIS